MGRPDPRLLLRDRSHDTGKLLQDGSRYPARLGSSGAHPPPVPRLLPGSPPPPPPPASPRSHHFLSRGRASLRKNHFPEDWEARGEAEEGARAGGARGEGRAPGASALALPSPGAPRDRCLPWLGALFFFSQLTCLSSGPEGAQRKGRRSGRGSPSASEGRSRRARGSAPVSLPPSLPASPLLSPLLLPILSDTTQPLLFPPSHLGAGSVDAERTQ